jgi:hypothetical protein
MRVNLFWLNDEQCEGQKIKPSHSDEATSPQDGITPDSRSATSQEPHPSHRKQTIKPPRLLIPEPPKSNWPRRQEWPGPMR